MSPSGSVFSATVQSITTTKLEELSKKRQKFEAQQAALLAEVDSREQLLDKVILLSNGIAKCLGIQISPKADHSPTDSLQPHRINKFRAENHDLEVEFETLHLFLDQARYDPSVSERTLKRWQETCMRHLNMQSSKYQFATLYGELVMEWLSSEKPPTAVGTDDYLTVSEGYEEITVSGKKLESRRQWEEAVFTPHNVDTPALTRYLAALFTDNGDEKTTSKALHTLRQRVKGYEESLNGPRQFSNSTLTWAIDGLLQSDLLDNDKRAALRDFKRNQLVLGEIADVLNMRMAALSSWSWGDCVDVEQRRKVTGTYSVYMHEDLLQAIFLQYMGVKWSVFFCATFKQFTNSVGPSRPRDNEIPKAEMAKLKHFLPCIKTRGSVNHARRKLDRNSFELFQLLRIEHQQLTGEEGAEEANFAKPAQQVPPVLMQQGAQMQQASQPARRGVPGMSYRRMMPSGPKEEGNDEDDDEDDRDDWDDYDDSWGDKDPIATKQKLLHYLATDIIINRHVHGETTVFHARFNDWMPSLPHDTILYILQFFGVSERYLKFFETFLKAPLKFIDEADSEPRRRQRGTPGAHVLSEVFGEAILFVLDFAVNKTTQGASLHRMHDDVWFWSPSGHSVHTAWKKVTEFADVMGISLDMQKSGSARIVRSSSTNSTFSEAAPDSGNNASLPIGDIRWGFLRLDPQSGQFAIDTEMLDSHITDLQKQLRNKHSIFAWIAAWNTFATTFFKTNFGQPANCYGKPHLDSILAALARVQKRIFAETGHDSVVAYLKDELKKRFAFEHDIPDGFLFFPAELGGLDLVNPFIGPLQIRDNLPHDPTELLAKFDEAEADSYRRLRADWEKRDQQYNGHGHRPENDAGAKRQRTSSVNDDEDFLTFAEYTKHRISLNYKFHPDLSSVFTNLQLSPTPTKPEPTQELMHALQGLDSRPGTTWKNVVAAGGERLPPVLSQNNGWVQVNSTSMEPYWQAVAAMYGPEVVKLFGGLKMVDEGVLPMGMVGLLKGGLVSWS